MSSLKKLLVPIITAGAWSLLSNISPASAQSQMDYVLQGEGETTLVFEAGFGQDRSTWGPLLEALGGDFATLTYARAGLGTSPAPDHPLTIEEHNSDLGTLLSDLGITSEIVLVGHSYGGLLVTEFARDQMDQVSALILIDPSIMEQRSIAKEVDAERVAADDEMLLSMIPPQMGREYQTLVDQMDEAPATVTPLPADLPVLIFTSTATYEEPFVFEETDAGRVLWLQGHSDLIAQSRTARHLRMPDVGHNIQLDAPETVAHEISDFIDSLN